MKTLFIVRSPLQVLNAIEAKHYFKTKNNVLLIIHGSSSINSEQMESVAQLSPFDEVIHWRDAYHSSRWSKLHQHLRWIQDLQKSHYHYLFSGDYGTINQIIIANIQFDNIYLLDDGTLTLQLHMYRLNPNKEWWHHVNFKLFRYLLIGRVSIFPTRKINFFTNYTLIPHRNEKIVRNEYLYLREHYLKYALKKDTIYLLGQPLFPKMIKADLYVNYIKRFIELYPKKQIFYIPHRHETVLDTMKALENTYFQIGRNEGPIEIVFISQHIYPMHIVSFTSSALVNLKHLFPDACIEAIYIKEKDILTRQDAFKMCYDEFRASSILVQEI